ncbi:MAG: hypothetical protein MUP21_03855 [Dehalococcoidia bacterium]|nr:hypothetical protein [Dehalococcoidia bacterium]
MSKRVFSIIAYLIPVIIITALLSSCLTTSDLIPRQTITTQELEDEIYRLVNEERQNAGFTQLARDPLLDNLAGYYSANGFSSSAEQFSDIRYLLRNSWWVTYNTGAPSVYEDDAREQVDYCLENYELRQTIFRSDARATGIGVSILGDTVYYTQVFDVLNAARGNGVPVMLYENPNAIDLSWEQLKRFLSNVNTDEQPYIADLFVCADFAAMLHDRAETAGIKSAYVSVDFLDGPGHALDAFNTVDRGLVYIDCTGRGLNTVTSDGISGSGGASVSYDKVAYLSTGYEYGLISLDRVSSFDYTFYEHWLSQWESYQAKVAVYEQKTGAYETAVAGRTVITDPDEYTKLQSMFEELESLKEELEEQESALGDFRWEPLGTVIDFYVHW